MHPDIVMLTSAHTAMDDRIFYREAATLKAANYQVAIVGRHPRTEVVDGVSICGLKTATSRGERLLLGWTILKTAIELDASLYIIHDPELIGVALILRLLGNRVIYDAHENLPAQIRQKDWIPVPLRWGLIPLVAAVEWIASRLLSGVIAAVPAIRDRFPRSRSELVRNFPTSAALAVLADGAPLSARANVVIYTGGLSDVRGTRQLVEAFRGLDEAELWLVGDFDNQDFQTSILKSLPTNVVWLGWRPHLEVLRLYRLAKLGAVLLYPTPNHRCALPVKLFEYLGAGLPVLASNFPEYVEFVKDCGFQVDPTDVGKIREALCELLANPAELERMSVRARDRVLKRFSWELEGVRLVNFCEQRMAKPRLSGISLADSSTPTS